MTTALSDAGVQFADNSVQPSAAAPQIVSIGASVASNALTLTLSACALSFRNTTLTNGAPAGTVNVGALSITVPSSATLGTVNATQARLVLLVAYSGGSPVLCVVNLAGGAKLDETNLISPTTISSGSTSASTIYSASAVSANSPYRVVGFVDVSETTAGTWATAPTTAQGIGGQALAALSSIGYGQTWQSVTRTAGTTYYNATGKPIMGWGSYAASSTSGTVSLSINGGTAFPIATNAVPSGVAQCGYCYMIPAGCSYALSVTSGSLSSQSELR